ncbi:Mlp lipoprotein family protein (plasmid) [Borrelia miyamotoi FR64b]|uniref:Mlp lipoprotein family protein n=1 Tax=Borrelia miyamotoi FR64b TaxID=1292392 RepID=W5SGH5_9SPIR|nr:Mlp lipoprotein family protein [Borrelia miyamotoi FR64b]
MMNSSNLMFLKLDLIHQSKMLKTTRPRYQTNIQGFISWLLNKPPKQKELANAFTIVYDFRRSKATTIK